MARSKLTRLRTPAEHARDYGTSADLLAAADALHGWTLHEHHAGRPMQLAPADYLDAIAAIEFDIMIPAERATSPHRHRRL